MIFLQNAKIPIVKPISAADYYQVRRCYGEVSLDLASLTDFYLPLVGSDAFSVYLCLSRIATTTFVHSDLVGFVDLTLGQIENAIRKLEAVGLVHTFFQNEGNTRLFVYCLYAPLHAKEFAEDIMLSGTLKGKIGIETFTKLFSRYQGIETPDDLEEVTASFPEVFKPEKYDAQFYLSSTGKADVGGKAMAKCSFDIPVLLAALDKLGARKNLFDHKELTEIQQIGELFFLDAKTMADFAFDCKFFDKPYGQRLNKKALMEVAEKASTYSYLRPQEESKPSNVHGDTPLANDIRLMDTTPPRDYLWKKQGGHRPAAWDLTLVARLRVDFGLPDPCINALVSFLLDTQDNQIPAALAEKLAASLVRKKCRTAREALDYLYRSNSRKRKKVEEEKAEEASPAPSKEPKSDQQNPADLERLNEKLRKLYGDKK